MFGYPVSMNHPADARSARAHAAFPCVDTGASWTAFLIGMTDQKPEPRRLTLIS